MDREMPEWTGEKKEKEKEKEQQSLSFDLTILWNLAVR